MTICNDKLIKSTNRGIYGVEKHLGDEESGFYGVPKWHENGCCHVFFSWETNKNINTCLALFSF